jgi:hypothetical protein
MVMRPDRTGHWPLRSGCRLGGVAAVAITAGLVPLAAANSREDGDSARSAAATGVVFGGQTGEGWPVMVELSKNHRRVVRTVIGLDMRCTSGQSYSDWWRFSDVAVNKKRKFHDSFGPDTYRYDDGTGTYDVESRISGALNRAHSRVSGTWRSKLTDYDNTGAVTDTCVGSVRWTAKQ